MKTTIKYDVKPNEIKSLNDIEIIFDKVSKYTNDIIEFFVKGKSFLKAVRKYTYKAKNQIKTAYLHIQFNTGKYYRQTKTGWKLV